MSKLPPRPTPETTVHSDPFWRAARDSRLVVQHCPVCDRWQHPPRPWCTKCLRLDLEFLDVRGTGTIYAYTIIRRAAGQEFADRVPYVYALVDLDEGVRMVANIVDCDVDTVRIGQRVRATFEPIDDVHTLVQFTRVSDS